MAKPKPMHTSFWPRDMAHARRVIVAKVNRMTEEQVRAAAADKNGWLVENLGGWSQSLNGRLSVALAKRLQRLRAR